MQQWIVINGRTRLADPHQDCAPDVNRNWNRRHQLMYDQYFGVSPTYNDTPLVDVSGCQSACSQRVQDTVTANDFYFQQQPDTTGKFGISSLLKVTAALRVLSNVEALLIAYTMIWRWASQPFCRRLSILQMVLLIRSAMSTWGIQVRTTWSTSFWLRTNAASLSCFVQWIACTGNGRTALQALLGNTWEKVKSRHWFLRPWSTKTCDSGTPILDHLACWTT